MQPDFLINSAELLFSIENSTNGIIDSVHFSILVLISSSIVPNQLGSFRINSSSATTSYLIFGFIEYTSLWDKIFIFPKDPREKLQFFGSKQQVSPIAMINVFKQPGTIAYTSSPGFKCSIPFPTEITIPEQSEHGGPGFPGYKPITFNKSLKFNPTEHTLIKTCLSVSINFLLLSVKLSSKFSR
ncbi:hypothetical protein HWI79_128 [Cryptosporidium felis]|nr:hypothetical protein HWI79_128 [Cryptosporidium felis]